MPHGMAVVEDRTTSLFALVFFYNGHLQSNTTCNELAEQASLGMSKVSQGMRMRLKLCEQFSIEYDTILYYFCPPLRTLTYGQGEQRSGIGQYQPRLVKRADQVLAPGMVDACFAPDGGINLGQQGCRHLHQWYTPQVGGGGIAGQVTHDATSKRDNGLAPLCMLLYEPVIDGAKLTLRLAGLACRYGVDFRLKPSPREALYNCWRIEVTEVAIADQENPGRQIQLRQVLSQPSQATPIDDGIVAPRFIVGVTDMDMADHRRNFIKFAGTNQHSDDLLGNMFDAFILNRKAQFRAFIPGRTGCEQGI